jgi:hypothetical protein
MSLNRVVLRCSLIVVAPLFAYLPIAGAQARPRILEKVDDAKRITLKGNVHPLARAENDRGAVADAQPMNRILLLLKRSDEQETALQTMLQNQQDKSSPSYHQWLTPEQFGAQFGPADEDIQAVTDWLTRQGFSVDKVYSGKTVLEFSGTVAQVQQAFGTAIHSYYVNGKTYSANASDPQIPAALAPVVAGVVSLHNFPREFYSHHSGALRRSGGKTTFEPFHPLVTNTYEGTFGVGPGDFARIYGTPALCGTPAAACNGANQTIAIVGETNFNLSDVQQFRSIFGLPATFDANSIVYNGEDPGITSTDEEGEALLDTEWSGGVAPGATIKYVLSASTSASQGVDLSALYIVEHNLAAVMSESYGACEPSLGTAENSFVNSLWEQASAQGITVAVSSGDSGSAGCDDPHTENLATHAPAVNGLASTPYNVAVGGTDFDEWANPNQYWNATNDPTTGSSVLGYIPEIPWNESCAELGPNGCPFNMSSPNIIAAGGGASALYNRPSWQLGATGTLSGDGKRDLPDISVFASPGYNGSGYLYCQSDASAACNVSSGFAGPNLYLGEIGGTSASAPAFAGIVALVNQSQATSQNPAPRQGNANYILYALANKAGASCASSTPVAAGCVFNDVVAGNSNDHNMGKGVGSIDVPCQYPTPNCSATAASQTGVLDSPGNPSTMAWNVASGYDMASGLGSLNIGNLIAAWGTASTVPTTTTLTLNPATGLTHGTSTSTVTIKVAAKSGTATGVVSLIALLPGQPTGTTPFSVGAFTLGANGNASGSTQNLPGGQNYQVYAHYSGDGTNAPSDSAPVAVSVAQEASKTFIVIPTFDPSTGNEISANASSVTYGNPYIVRIYVTNSGGNSSPNGTPNGVCTQATQVACPSGTISLTANGNPADGGTFRLNDIGYTRDIAPSFSAGTYALTAVYGGDSSYTGSSASETFTVNAAATTLNAPSYTPTVLVGAATWIYTDITTQSSTGVPPSGTVTFYDGSTVLPGNVTLIPISATSITPAHTVAELNTTFTSPGLHVITAKYGGDANYAAAPTSPSTTIPVVYGTSITFSVSTTSITYGQSITLTAVIRSQGKTPSMTGEVQFSGGPSYSNITTTPGTDINGNQMLTVTATTVPSSSAFYSASYSGDINYEFASSNETYVSVAIPDFTMGPPSGLSVVPPAGQTGTGQIMISPVSQTPSTVVLQPPSVVIAGYTIALSTLQVNLTGSVVPVSLTLTPNTGAVAASARGQIRKAAFLTFDGGSRWKLCLAGVLAILFTLGVPGRRSRLRVGFGLSSLCLLYFLLGCGGGSGSASGGGGGGGTNPQATSITLTTSNPHVNANGPLTITAAVSGSANFSGTVTFYDYGVVAAGPYPVDALQPQVQIGTNNLGVGLHQLSAKFSGDANNLPSSSTTINQTITGTMVTSITGATGADTHSIQVTIGLQ